MLWPTVLSGFAGRAPRLWATLALFVFLWQHPLHCRRKNCGLRRHAATAGGILALICQRDEIQQVMLWTTVPAVKQQITIGFRQTGVSYGAVIVPMLLLLLVVLGFCGMVGRAARAGFAACGTGGFGVAAPPGELEEDATRRRVATSGLVSARGGVFSGEPGSDWDLFSDEVGLAADIPISINQ